jgi:hypothetical protein
MSGSCPGDYIAIIVAGQWQRDGYLKAGKIVRVCRDPIEVS